jgi:hypothetical protein
MRTQSRKTGRVPVTEIELRRFNGLGFAQTNGSRSGIRTFVFTTTDFTADTRAGESVYRIDVDHNAETQSYFWTLFKADNSGAVNLFDWAQERNTLRLWFHANTLDITVMMIF